MLQAMRDTAADAQQVAGSRSRSGSTLHAVTGGGGGGGSSGTDYEVTNATIDTVEVGRGDDIPVTATVKNSAGEPREVTVQVYVGDSLAGSHTQELPGPGDVIYPDGEEGTTTTEEVLVIGDWKPPFCGEGAGLHEVTVKVAGSDATHSPGNVVLQSPEGASRADICDNVNPSGWSAIAARLRELIRSNPTAVYGGAAGFLFLLVLLLAI